MADGDDDETRAPDDLGEFDDATGFGDESLLSFAPTRILPVLGTALLLVALGAAGFAATALVLRVDVAYLSVVIPTLSGLTVAAGLAHGVFGWRAYRTFTEPDVAQFMRVQVVGLWVVSTCFVVAGIVGGVLGADRGRLRPRLLAALRLRAPARQAPRHRRTPLRDTVAVVRRRMPVLHRRAVGRRRHFAAADAPAGHRRSLRERRADPADRGDRRAGAVGASAAPQGRGGRLAVNRRTAGVSRRSAPSAAGGSPDCARRDPRS